MSRTRFDVATFLARFDALDAALVRAGFPPTSPWWRAQLERALRSGRRRWVLRVGRRGGKSSTLCRLAVAWALWAPWSVPPGDVAVVAFVSIDRDEAAGRLLTIREILTALGVPFDSRGDEIELRERRCVFSVTTCSVRGTVGFTSVLVIADEMARWESRDTSANPAREVMASLRPTMATQPIALEVCSSSPWSMQDYHHELFEAGDTAHQVVSFAATWTANPTLTEQRTRELEPDERIWRREYAAIPQAASLAAFDPASIERAFRPPPRVQTPPLARIVSLDPSSGRKDAWTWAVVSWSREEIEIPPFAYRDRQLEEIPGIYFGYRYVNGPWMVPGPNGPVPLDIKPPRIVQIVEHLDGIEGTFFGQISAAEIVARIAALARSYGVTSVHSDQREEFALSSLFRDAGLSFRSHPWTGGDNGLKTRMVSSLRRRLAEGTVFLPEHERLRFELHSFEEKITPGGSLTFGARGTGHDDYVACLLTAQAVEIDGLPGNKYITTGR